MRQPEIKYIAFYDLPGDRYRRNYALAAVSKMNYICESLHRCGRQVHIVSASYIVQEGVGFQPSRTEKVNDYTRLTLFPSFGTRSKPAMYLKIIFTLFCLFVWLLRHTKKDEPVLVYHSPWLSLPVCLARKIRRFRLILEVEEIYADITSLNRCFDRLEYRLIRTADTFLLSTDLLADRIAGTKPRIVVYGQYTVEPVLAAPPADGKIHLLYAGVIDADKAGAFNALEATRYLDERYVLHMIGFGDEELLRHKIAELRPQTTCRTEFDGLKSGNDYIRYAQACQIGLSTQKMSGQYLSSSFPSKILSYLALGLTVVSCRVECVCRSAVGNQVVYYTDDTPQAIAEAVRKTRPDENAGSRELMERLNREFIENLKGWL